MSEIQVSRVVSRTFDRQIVLFVFITSIYKQTFSTHPVNKIAWLDSNCRFLVLEANTLPTVPKPLILYIFKEKLLNCYWVGFQNRTSPIKVAVPQSNTIRSWSISFFTKWREVYLKKLCFWGWKFLKTFPFRIGLEAPENNHLRLSIHLFEVKNKFILCSK